MTDSYRGDSHLDAAIDRAVRELMSAEPRTDLRERVLTKIAAASARAAFWPRLAFGSAAIAVAAVAMLLLVDRPINRPVERIADATRPAESRRPDPPAPATPPRKAPAPAGTPVLDGGPKSAPALRGRAATDRVIRAASIEPGEAIGIEPMTPVERLAPIEPLGMPALDAPLVATSAIHIAPMIITRIEMTPLAPPR